MNVSMYCMYTAKGIIFRWRGFHGRESERQSDHKRKEGSEEFSGCAKESQACLFFFGWVGQGDWGQKNSNWSTKGTHTGWELRWVMTICEHVCTRCIHWPRAQWEGKWNTNKGESEWSVHIYCVYLYKNVSQRTHTKLVFYLQQSQYFSDCAREQLWHALIFPDELPSTSRAKTLRRGTEVEGFL